MSLADWRMSRAALFHAWDQSQSRRESIFVDSNLRRLMSLVDGKRHVSLPQVAKNLVSITGYKKVNRKTEISVEKENGRNEL